MSQSSLIVAMLLAGFLLYLAAKGRLAHYTTFFFGEPKGGSNSGGSDGVKDDVKDEAVDTAGRAALGPWWDMGDYFV